MIGFLASRAAPLAVLLVTITLTAGCSATTAVLHGFRSTEHYTPLPADPRVRHEPGAEAFAGRVAAVLPAALHTVEESQSATFPEPPTVFVCATHESYRDLTGRDAKALTWRRAVFLSPRLLDGGDGELAAYLTHELSHLLLVLRLPGSRLVEVPAWFKEGLATLVSGGGGAGRVSESEAAAAIRAGRSFHPHLDAGYRDLLFPRYGSHWDLEPHMFYRQSMLFVRYLRGRNLAAWQRFLTALHAEVPFPAAFAAQWGSQVEPLWDAFVASLAEAPRRSHPGAW